MKVSLIELKEAIRRVVKEQLTEIDIEPAPEEDEIELIHGWHRQINQLRMEMERTKQNPNAKYAVGYDTQRALEAMIKGLKKDLAQAKARKNQPSKWLQAQRSEQQAKVPSSEPSGTAGSGDQDDATRFPWLQKGSPWSGGRK